ncbi:MAG: cytochrome c oxidase subunit 3 [Leptospira sp.]|nr:cytochrome c oxidase subunit 3 [Leptospira sp.]
MREEKLNNEKSFLYPPGGILIWIIVLVEVITFFMGIGSLLFEKNSNPKDFLEMQSSLNVNFAVWNTIFLLTSGYAIVIAVHFHDRTEQFKFNVALLTAIFFGIFFLGLKGWEYAIKVNDGLGLDAGIFWGYYWLLTGFHYMHVVVGILILLIIFFYRNTIERVNLEAGAVFWHMCDLIWVVLFPVLYLIH